MQGVEVFESVGAAAEELKPKDAFVREVASAALHAALPVAFAKRSEADILREAQLGEAEWCVSGAVEWLLLCLGPDPEVRFRRQERRQAARRIACFQSASSWTIAALRRRPNCTGGCQGLQC